MLKEGQEHFSEFYVIESNRQFEFQQLILSGSIINDADSLKIWNDIMPNRGKPARQAKKPLTCTSQLELNCLSSRPRLQKWSQELSKNPIDTTRPG